MPAKKLVFAQLTDHLPLHLFRKCVAKYDGNRWTRSFTCLDQFLCMAFAQLTNRQSLRDIEVCLRTYQSHLYHIGIRGNVSRNTLSHANRRRDWRIYADFGQELIQEVRQLYGNQLSNLDLKGTVYALDSSTVDLCLSVFPWALFRSSKAAIKMHTLLDLQGNIPSFILITPGKDHDVKFLDSILPEAGSYYIMDRAYVDFQRLFRFEVAGAFFVTRLKSNAKFRCRVSRPVDKSTGLRCDQTIFLTGQKSKQKYPQGLRRVKYYDRKSRKTFNFLTNNFAVSAQTITELYRHRWQIELFFKWIKQHLRIKRFFGTSENAVKTQIWIAVSVYILLATIRERLHIPCEMHTMMQILSLTLFEEVPLYQLLTGKTTAKAEDGDVDQLRLFDCGSEQQEAVVSSQ